ncbi:MULTISPECIES: hypothetical protein [Streptomyces]|uniref:hypothetical protein n=1 Tax=Streptomyces TaxID=1883 RepID=UPI0029C08844|nr:MULTISPECIES: hypothetical protein [Streptomyces]
MDVEVGERDAPAITSPSASGKSTLLHSLAGIIRLDDSQVQLRGERIDKLGDVQLNKVVGTTINNSGAAQLAVRVAVGALAMLAAIAGSRPLLQKARDDPGTDGGLTPYRRRNRPDAPCM